MLKKDNYLLTAAGEEVHNTIVNVVTRREAAVPAQLWQQQVSAQVTTQHVENMNNYNAMISRIK